MKKIFIAIACTTLMVSCSTIRKSSVSTLDVSSVVTSAGTADLDVSQQKISYTYLPTSQDKKSGLKNVINNAVTEALKANGNADVMVGMNYDAVMKKKGKVKSIIITGYPAKYRNFSTAK